MIVNCHLTKWLPLSPVHTVKIFPPKSMIASTEMNLKKMILSPRLEEGMPHKTRKCDACSK